MSRHTCHTPSGPTTRAVGGSAEIYGVSENCNSTAKKFEFDFVTFAVSTCVSVSVRSRRKNDFCSSEITHGIKMYEYSKTVLGEEGEIYGCSKNGIVRSNE